MGMKFKEVQKSKRPLIIEDLSCGDVFVFENYLFIFVNDTFDIDCVPEGNHYAINLSDGHVKAFNGGEIIKKVKSSFEIEIDKDDLEEWI